MYAHSVADCTAIIASVETEYCLAAGAKLNAGKTKLLLLNSPSPPACPYCVLSGSDSTRALGATFREEHRDLVDFDQIVAKMRLRLGSWLRVHPSLLARAILANAVISCESTQYTSLPAAGRPAGLARGR